MSADVTLALKNRLAGDATLIAQLGTYNGQPAIFMADPIPGDADPETALPYVVSDGNDDDFRSADLDDDVRQVDRSIRVYAENSGDPASVENAAGRVYELMDTSITVAGWSVLHVIRRGPRGVEEDSETYVREVDVTMILEQSP